MLADQYYNVVLMQQFFALCATCCCIFIIVDNYVIVRKLQNKRYNECIMNSDMATIMFAMNMYTYKDAPEILKPLPVVGSLLSRPDLPIPPSPLVFPSPEF